MKPIDVTTILTVWRSIEKRYAFWRASTAWQFAFLLKKPDRTYHCKRCRKCIRRYDHHCVYVGNCIGVANYKIFLNMLSYLICVLFTLTFIVLKVNRFSIYLYKDYVGVVTSCFVLFAIFVLESMVFYFFVYHLSCLTKGVTEFEHIFRKNTINRYLFLKIEAESNFSKFLSIFGTNPLIWFLPFSCMINRCEQESWNAKILLL